MSQTKENPEYMPSYVLEGDNIYNYGGNSFNDISDDPKLFTYTDVDGGFYPSEKIQECMFMVGEADKAGYLDSDQIAIYDTVLDIMATPTALLEQKFLHLLEGVLAEAKANEDDEKFIREEKEKDMNVKVAGKKDSESKGVDDMSAYELDAWYRKTPTWFNYPHFLFNTTSIEEKKRIYGLFAEEEKKYNEQEEDISFEELLDDLDGDDDDEVEQSD
jgi:hypothetical protein